MRIFTPDAYYDAIYNIDFTKILNHGIKGIILDLDNTLVPYDVEEPDQKLLSWINKLKEYGLKLYILSNNTRARVERFNRELGLPAVYKANKPLMKRFWDAAKEMGMEPKKVAVIGDQLFTDVLGAHLSGMYAIMVKPVGDDPYLSGRIKKVLEKPFLRRYIASINKNGGNTDGA